MGWACNRIQPIIVPNQKSNPQPLYVVLYHSWCANGNLYNLLFPHLKAVQIVGR